VIERQKRHSQLWPFSGKLRPALRRRRFCELRMSKHRITRKTLYRPTLQYLLCACLLALVIQLIGPAEAANRAVIIARDVLLESGSATSPNAIIRTPDGGYAIVGSIASAAWAIRVDSNFRVLWRHTVDHPALAPADGASGYTGAVVLPDNSVLLCGFLAGRTGTASNDFGLLTRISPSGQVISNRQVTPLNDESFKLATIDLCTATDEGIIAVGNALQVTGDSKLRTANRFIWIFRSDSNTAEMQWQKLVENPDGGAVEQILRLPNSDLAIQIGDGMVLIDREGNLKDRRSQSNEILVKSITPDPAIHTMSGYGVATTTLLNDRLQEISRIKGVQFGIIARRAYRLGDGTIALFGTKPDGTGAYTAAAASLAPGLSSSSAITLGPDVSSPGVMDAVPTGVEGEFATVRLVVPTKHLFGPSEDRLGLGLTFVRFK
jgi:hypothetical protein